MLVRRRHLQALTRPPALLTEVALVAYLAAAIGFPLPARLGPAARCCAGACGCPAEKQARANCCCCAPKRPNCCQQAKADAPREPTLRWVIGEQQQRCRGLATVWLSV